MCVAKASTEVGIFNIRFSDDKSGYSLASTLALFSAYSIFIYLFFFMYENIFLFFIL